MTSVLILTQKAEVKLSKLSTGPVTLKEIKTYFKKKTDPELIGTYNYKGLTLFLFAYVKGKAGNENKHELPPPHDSILVFGDIMLIASKDEKSFSNPVPFKIEDYEQFYSKTFGGFEDIDEDDEDDEDEEEIEIEEDIELDNENEVIEEEYNDNVEDNLSCVSEEIIIIKKEKKKKISNANIIPINIHPSNQLNENSEKNVLRNKIINTMKILFIDKLSNNEINTLEQELYITTLKQAESKYIIKDWSIKTFTHIYLSLVRKIISNFDSNSYVKNNELFDRYKNKEISLKDISIMDNYSLFKSKWIANIEHQKNIEQRQLEGNKSMATDQFLCTRCYKRECTYYEMQTRSADEAMTIFINCLNCGKNWRQ